VLALLLALLILLAFLSAPAAKRCHEREEDHTLMWFADADDAVARVHYMYPIKKYSGNGIPKRMCWFEEERSFPLQKQLCHRI
jgi:hypothetical protein